MLDVYIEAINYVSLNPGQQKQPRERFIRYYTDLHHLYKKDLDNETFYQGGQFTFAELGEQVLDPCVSKGWMQSVDLLLPTYWSPEFDPDYSSCGPYLQERYGLNGQLFDVCEQGTLAGFTGIHIINEYLATGQHKKAIFLALEQTTVPRLLSDHDLIPQRNAACAMLLTTTATNSAFKIRAILHINTDKQSCFERLEQILTEIKAEQSVCVVLKKSTQLWKQIKHMPNVYLSCKFEFIPAEMSMLPVFEYLYLLKQGDTEKTNIYILIEEDAESLNAGILMLETVRS